MVRKRRVASPAPQRLGGAAAGKTAGGADTQGTVLSRSSLEGHNRAVAAPVLEVEGEVDFMSLLSEPNRLRLLEGSRTETYAPGAVIFRPGDSQRAFLVERGLARGYTSVPDGRQATVTFFHSRELIGGTAIASRPPKIYVQVVVKSTMICLKVETVRQLAKTENEVIAAVATHLAARIRSAYRLVAIRTLGDIKQRLAYDLLDRACRTQLESGRLEAGVTQSD